MFRAVCTHYVPRVFTFGQSYCSVDSLVCNEPRSRREDESILFLRSHKPFHVVRRIVIHKCLLNHGARPDRTVLDDRLIFLRTLHHVVYDSARDLCLDTLVDGVGSCVLHVDRLFVDDEHVYVARSYSLQLSHAANVDLFLLKADVVGLVDLLVHYLSVDELQTIDLERESMDDSLGLFLPQSLPLLLLGILVSVVFMQAQCSSLLHHNVLQLVFKHLLEFDLL